MNRIGLAIEVPVASFRMPYTREYAESYEIPPPATVYGMLLALVGEENRYRHIGAQIAIARPAELGEPERSVVLRTFRRIKKKPVSDPTNARPDFQEVLTGIHLAVWVDSGKERDQSETLVSRLTLAFSQPEKLQRFGGLSLGESRDLIDSVELLSENNRDSKNPYRFGAPCYWLTHNDTGTLSMPYWTDHIGSAKTRWASYELVDGVIEEPKAEHWTSIFQPNPK